MCFDDVETFEIKIYIGSRTNSVLVYQVCFLYLIEFMNYGSMRSFGIGTSRTSSECEDNLYESLDM